MDSIRCRLKYLFEVNKGDSTDNLISLQMLGTINCATFDRPPVMAWYTAQILRFTSITDLRAVTSK